MAAILIPHQARLRRASARGGGGGGHSSEAALHRRI